MKLGIFFVAISALLVLIAATAVIASIIVWRFLDLLIWTAALLASLGILGVSIDEYKKC